MKIKILKFLGNFNIKKTIILKFIFYIIILLLIFKTIFKLIFLKNIYILFFILINS